MDPIADFLSQIINAYSVDKEKVETSWSKFKERLARLLKAQGYLGAIKTSKDGKGKKRIILTLKYTSAGRPVLNKIKRVSTPGRRFYVSTNNMPRSLIGTGRAIIISTPKGLMTVKQAKKKNLGGEVICQIVS